MSFITINLGSLLSVFFHYQSWFTTKCLFHWFDQSLSLWCLGITSGKVSLEVLGIGNLQKELKFINDMSPALHTGTKYSSTKAL